MTQEAPRVAFRSKPWKAATVALPAWVSAGGRFGLKFRNHLQRILVIVTTACGILRWRVALLLGLSLVAIGTRGAALLTLMSFVKQAVNQTEEVPAWMSMLWMGPSFPIWSGLLCLGVFLVSALASFGCGRLSSRFAIECVKELIPARFGRALADIKDLQQPMISIPLGDGAVRFARLVRHLLTFPLTALTLLLGLGFLFAISAPTTLVLLVALPTIAAPLYLLNRTVIRENREMRHLQREVGSARREAVNAIMADRDADAVEAALKTYVHKPSVVRRNSILVQIWTLGHRVGLVSETFGNTLLVGLAFSLPFVLSLAQELAAEMLGYIVALRLTLGAMQDAARRLTFINRFLEPAECLLNPRLAMVHYPVGDGEAGDDVDSDEL